MYRNRLMHRRVEKAQSLVELALSLTVMLLLVAGAVDFGMAFFSYVAMRDAAQEGALYGSFAPYTDLSPFNNRYDNGEPVNDAGIRTRVREASRSPVDFQDTAKVPDSYITIGIVPPAGKACEGNTPVSTVQVPNAIRVTVEYDYPLTMPFIGAIIGGQNIHLTATVTDTILEPRCP